MYSVMADNTTDISWNDQLTICVLYVDSVREVSERLLEMCYANDKNSMTEEIHR